MCLPLQLCFRPTVKANKKVRPALETVTVRTKPPPHVPIDEAIKGITLTKTCPVEVQEFTINKEFIPSSRSGSYAHTGFRDYMEDEHLRIDDLSICFELPSESPRPAAFYGVFDGHGGPEAATFVKNNITKILFQNTNFPMSIEVEKGFIGDAMDSLQRAYLLADKALSDARYGVSPATGTTALTALIFGRILMVANAGDCRAVLCRNGVAVDMSQDHRPANIHEMDRVKKLGARVLYGRLDGILSVTRALGDWDMKIPGRAAGAALSPLISDPDFQHVTLTEDDEFLILASDGIWAVMSSWRAVNIVRKELKKHNDPKRAARKLVRESYWLGANDNATVVVVCLSSQDQRSSMKLRPKGWLGRLLWWRKNQVISLS
ncbi:hypothetical protein SAY86_024776 [Trapa natans]|uniref:protein-serine/threonine phosphatase n=1 Tax=Trapa natans TaxID=22666 RepID=A0AAN7RIC9_TRANT|nr:hypothetical protein SAY86_024776 [Trapa natans]